MNTILFILLVIAMGAVAYVLAGVKVTDSVWFDPAFSTVPAGGV